MPKTFTWGNALAKGGARRRVNAGGGRFGSTTLRLDGGEGDVPSEPRAKKEHTVSVDDDEVSAEHLRVFLEDGHWVCPGPQLNERHRARERGGRRRDADRAAAIWEGPGLHVPAGPH